MEIFHYRKLKNLNLGFEDSLKLKPEISFLEEEDQEEDMNTIFEKEFSAKEFFKIEVPSKFEKVTPPEPMGLPPHPPRINKK